MSASAEAEVAPVAVCTLQSPARLSNSLLWDLQRDYYHKAGPDAWENSIVPHFITTNAFIARQYAHVVLQFLSDFAASSGSQLLPHEPVYIVELGSGHGKFGFLFLRQLDLLRDEYPAVAGVRVKYILTDFTDSNVRYWEQHTSLKEYVERGDMDFAVFDAENDGSLMLRHAKVEVNASRVKNPMVCIANYLFDSLKYDAFQFQQRELREGLLELGSTRAEDVSDPTDSDVLDRVVPKWTFQSIPASDAGASVQYQYYPDHPAWNQVLQFYVDHGHDSTVLLPIGAFRCIQRFLELSDSNLLVISGDKGYSHIEAYHSLTAPHLAVHGSFSFMVNYHAIALLMKALLPSSSIALNTSQHEGSLKITTLLSCKQSQRITTDFAATIRTYRTRIDEFGPDDFFFLQQSVKDSPRPSVRHIISLIKLSCFDPETFYKLAEHILEQIDEQQELNCLDIQGVLEKVWRNWFRMNLQADVPFEMGRICFGLGHYRPALRYYAYSHELVGESYITYYNMGIALYELGDLHGAERMLQRSLALNEYDRSIIWLAKTRKERQQRLLDGQSDYSCAPETVEDLTTFVKSTLSRIL